MTDEVEYGVHGSGKAVLTPATLRGVCAKSSVTSGACCELSL